MAPGRWVQDGPRVIRKKLLEGLEETYARIKHDRDEDERWNESQRIAKMSPREAQEYWQSQARRLNHKGYTQPAEASWREFLQERGWTPKDIDELPDDWLLSEWGRYQLRIIYSIGSPGRGGMGL